MTSTVVAPTPSPHTPKTQQQQLPPVAAMGNSNLGFGLTSFNHTGTATSSFPPNPVSGQMAPCGEGDRHVLMQEPRLQHHLLYETMEPVTHVGYVGRWP
ncbi:Os08g0474300 [Oryza sativa Japonica Group]|uniref:Os08g0474300 protein n=1 Tax=Oryza sativa subsp. japonica TaxID=39947 RepID=A0A0P0XGQ3_ORYSJ|nr:Os08g0474300 [Oryza sativa Japonica Group]